MIREGEASQKKIPLISAVSELLGGKLLFPEKNKSRRCLPAAFVLLDICRLCGVVY